MRGDGDRQKGTDSRGLTTDVVQRGRAGDPTLVPITHRVPAALRAGPFTHAEARVVGVTRGQLRGAAYRRLGSGIYRWVGLKESPQVLLTAVARRLPTSAAFSGWTAAWLHGLDVAPCDPIEVTIPEPIGSGRRAGAAVVRAALGAEEILLRRRLPTTSPLRTAVDLGSRNPLTEGVVAADLFLHAGLVSMVELRNYVADHPGAKGIARLRRVVERAEPQAESPMETRLRMLLVLARLPRPEVQVSIHDDEGRFLGRPDLLYRRQLLAIEYDGGNHRDRMVDDNRRQNGLVGAGYRLLRFTSADVYGTPDSVAMQVRHSLGVDGRSHPGTNGRARADGGSHSGTNGRGWPHGVA
jgi:very-short-patch-repair endonuclease